MSKGLTVQDFPELVKDWDFSKNENLPIFYRSQSSKYVYWKCHVCGYEWKAKINNRVAVIKF